MNATSKLGAFKALCFYFYHLLCRSNIGTVYFMPLLMCSSYHFSNCLCGGTSAINVALMFTTSKKNERCRIDPHLHTDTKQTDETTKRFAA